jgi:hypothetical protein
VRGVNACVVLFTVCVWWCFYLCLCVCMHAQVSARKIMDYVHVVLGMTRRGRTRILCVIWECLEYLLIG